MLFTFSLFHLLKALAIFFTLSPFHPFTFKDGSDYIMSTTSTTPMRVSLFDFRRHANHARHPASIHRPRCGKMADARGLWALPAPDCADEVAIICKRPNQRTAIYPLFQRDDARNVRCALPIVRYKQRTHTAPARHENHRNGLPTWRKRAGC